MKTKIEMHITFVLPSEKLMRFNETFMEWLKVAGRLFQMNYDVVKTSAKEVA